MNKSIEMLYASKSEWIPLKDLPSFNTQKYKEMILDGQEGCYIVALKEHTDEIDRTNFISDKVGYIGKSGDVVSRTSNIRATVKSTATAVYHGLGSYIKNRLDKTPFDNYVVKYLYTTKEQDNGKLENELHRAMVDKFGYPFAWREASGGKDGRMERIAGDLMSSTDEEKLQFYEMLYAELPSILMRQYNSNLESRES
jgi:hypothetical protein